MEESIEKDVWVEEVEEIEVLSSLESCGREGRRVIVEWMREVDEGGGWEQGLK